MLKFSWCDSSQFTEFLNDTDIMNSLGFGAPLVFHVRHDDGQMKHNGVEVIGPFGQCKLNDGLNDVTGY